MSNTNVAKRYAKALFQLAKERNAIKRFEDEFSALKEVFASEDVLTIFTSPKLSIDKKKDLISNWFSSFSDEVKNTLMVLVEGHREDVTVEIADDFLKLVNDENGVADATVTSAKPITDAEMQEISTVFSKKIGRKALNITNVTDPSVIGGIKVQIGNSVFDGTVSRKLNRLERHLLS